MNAYVIRKYGEIKDSEQVEIDYPALDNDEVLVKFSTSSIRGKIGILVEK